MQLWQLLYSEHLCWCVSPENIKFPLFAYNRNYMYDNNQWYYIITTTVINFPYFHIGNEIAYWCPAGFLIVFLSNLPRLGKRKLILMVFVRLFDLSLLGFVLFLLVSERITAACDCGTPWTFLLPFKYSRLWISSFKLMFYCYQYPKSLLLFWLVYCQCPEHLAKKRLWAIEFVSCDTSSTADPKRRFGWLVFW